jgi:hypothetical protein
MLDHRHFLECVPALVAVKPAAHHLLEKALQKLKRQKVRLHPRIGLTKREGEKAHLYPVFKGELDPHWVATHKVQLTPELARQFLDRLHPINSGGWNHENVARYAALIDAGTWEGMSPMVFTLRGFLVDGKHRCAAVIASGKPIWVLRTITIVDETGLW